MQHSSVPAPYRHRSPNLSDSDDYDRASTSSSSSHPSLNTVVNLSSGASTSAAAGSSHHHYQQQQQQQQQAQRPQRPRLNHNHTASGSFVRIKRKNTPATSPPPALLDQQQQQASRDNHSSSSTVTGERTLDQIASKTCFICYGDSSEDAPSTTTPSTATSRTPSSQRKWIHPCKCSLVAHEDCLLHWVQISKPSASKNTPVSCPQCNTPYTMHQVDFPILNFIERIEAIWTRNVSKLLMVSIGMGGWTLLGIYGIWSIRQLAGDRLAEQLFQRKSVRWLTAPLVLPVIVLSRTHLLDSILPFLPLTLILNSTLPNTQTLYAAQPYLLTALHFTFPPTPALTICIIPWIRAAYLALRRRIFRTILGQRRPSPLASPATPQAVNDQGNGHAAGVPQLPGEADFVRNQQRMAQVGAAVEGVEAIFNDQIGGGNERRIVVTVSSGIRILAESLVFPWAAAGMGSLLLWLAKRQTASGRWLAKLLGVGVAASAAVNNGSNLLGMANRFMPPVREYIDPVWWRNALGGALLVLGKDIWSLTRQIMERKRADSRRIENQPFREGLDV